MKDLERFLEKKKIEQEYRERSSESQEKVRKLLAHIGRVVRVDPTVGEGLFFGNRLEEEGVREKLKEMVTSWRNALTEGKKDELYQAAVDFAGIQSWGEQYIRVNMDAPISLGLADRMLIKGCSSLVEAFRKQKVKPVGRARWILARDPLSRKSLDIPRRNAEVQMVCGLLIYALADLQVAREKGERREEKDVLSLASKALKQVGSLQNRQDRGNLLDTLLSLKEKTKDLEH